ncbi:MAG TPA: DUF2510 domain-containing protein, partial [Amycolatopsis sp.]
MKVIVDAPAAPRRGWYPDGHGVRWWNGNEWTAHTLLLAAPPTESPTSTTSPQPPEGTPPLPIATTAPATVTAGALRGTSFGDSWIEIAGTGPDNRALATIIAKRGRTGPKSLRVDDAVVQLVGTQVLAKIGDTRVGTLTDADTAAYSPVLRWANCPVESSGIVLIDAQGHAGSHLKLYLPSPDMLVPANALDPAVAILPAWDRAGGLSLAKRKADYALIEAAAARWWSGTARSAWIVLTRTGFTITAAMDGMPLPDLDPDRDDGLRSAWDARHPGLRQMQFETQVYQVAAGR